MTAALDRSGKPSLMPMPLQARTRSTSTSLEQGPGGASGNIVQGNFIGTDITGNAAVSIANGFGVNITPNNLGTANNNLIGGTAPAARNIISTNDRAEIAITGSRG